MKKNKVKVCSFFLLLSACASTEKPKIIPSTLGTAFAKEPKMIRFVLKDPPIIGVTSAGQTIRLGGFSGLRYLGKSKNGRYRFLTHTDRGPNPEPYKDNEGKFKRPFLIPNFQPRLIFLEADRETKTLEVIREVPLWRADGKPISGLPQNKNQESPVDAWGNPLPYDSFGLDLEGIAIAEDDSFWMVEEYGPSVVHFTPEGQLMEWMRPGSGLPKVLEQRQINRGFEGTARFENKLYAIMQSPIDNPPSENAKNAKKSSVVRLIEIDLKSQATVAQYVYPLESPKTDKIGDIAIVSEKKLLVIERNGEVGPKSFKKVFLADLSNASNIHLLSEKIAGANGILESMNPKDWKKNNIIPMAKYEVLDLVKEGLMGDKAEGIDIVDSQYLAIAMDNDFNVGLPLNRATGQVEMADELPAIYFFPIEKKIVDLF